VILTWVDEAITYII